MAIEGLALKKLLSNELSLCPGWRSETSIYREIFQVVEVMHRSNGPDSLAFTFPEF